jgi:uncharacterized protein YacL
VSADRREPTGRTDHPKGPPIVDNVWRAVAGLAATAVFTSFLMIANLWKNDGMKDARILQLEARATATESLYRFHVESDQRDRDATAAKNLENAASRARLETVLEGVKGEIDALLRALSRRGR